MSFQAVGSGGDLLSRARSLARTREQALSGSTIDDRLRSVVSRSWRRALDQGLDPDGSNPRRSCDSSDYEYRRSSTPLAGVVGEFRTIVETFADAAKCILVVTDADGTILWRLGAARVLMQADVLGFAEGALWTERTVGTNAIGTALAEAAPVQLFAAEHFEHRQVAWYCTAAPIHDPCTGALLGIVDISGPALALHPIVTALVDSMVRLAEGSLRLDHQRRLESLRTRAVGTWSRVQGPALLVDRDGWVAQSTGLVAPERVAVPRPGEFMAVSELGVCEPEPVGGGWLLRRRGVQATIRAEFDLTDRPTISVADTGPGWRRQLTTRQAEILLILHLAGRGGISQRGLSQALYGDSEHGVTVRAELSRLRRTIGDLIVPRPYRIAPEVTLTVRPTRRGELATTGLLRATSAPGLLHLQRNGVHQ